MNKLPTMEVIRASDRHIKLDFYKSINQTKPSSTINIKKDFTINGEIKSTSLSGSLNSALSISAGEICVITDHLTKFYPDFKRKVVNEHFRNNDYDIIVFKLRSTKDNFIPHCHYPAPSKPREQQLYLNYYEISLKQRCIEQHVIFDEDFGAGTDFSFGESYIYIQEALKKGLKVLFSDEYIGQHPEKYIFSPTDELNKSKSLGAIDCKLYGWEYVVNYLNFSMKKLEKREALYGTGLDILNKLNAYLLGAKAYKTRKYT